MDKWTCGKCRVQHIVVDELSRQSRKIDTPLELCGLCGIRQWTTLPGLKKTSGNCYIRLRDLPPLAQEIITEDRKVHDRAPVQFLEAAE